MCMGSSCLVQITATLQTSASKCNNACSTCDAPARRQLKRNTGHVEGCRQRCGLGAVTHCRNPDFWRASHTAVDVMLTSGHEVRPTQGVSVATHQSLQTHHHRWLLCTGGNRGRQNHGRHLKHTCVTAIAPKVEFTSCALLGQVSRAVKGADREAAAAAGASGQLHRERPHIHHQHMAVFQESRITVGG